MLKYLLIFLVVRLILCLCLMRNYDHPDEYWQGPEIAHKLAYGNGHETWEWSDQEPIRSHVYPLILSKSYKVLEALGIHSPDSLVLGPKLCQSVVGALYDLFLVLLSEFYMPGSAPQMILVNYTSWASLTFMSRTFVNSTETLLILVAFYLWNRRNDN